MKACNQYVAIHEKDKYRQRATMVSFRNTFFLWNFIGCNRQIQQYLYNIYQGMLWHTRCHTMSCAMRKKYAPVESAVYRIWLLLFKDVGRRLTCNYRTFEIKKKKGLLLWGAHCWPAINYLVFCMAFLLCLFC